MLEGRASLEEVEAKLTMVLCLFGTGEKVS